jgi:predicted AAA+ superfamily ATPase
MEIITRKHYADKVDSWIGKGNIIVLVGPRRVGKEKKILESNEKVYWDDLGLRNLKAEGGMDSYIEKVIENAVYKHLCYLGYKVQVGVLGAGEVDFVCTRPGETVYVQVTYLMGEQATRNMLSAPLRS